MRWGAAACVLAVLPAAGCGIPFYAPPATVIVNALPADPLFAPPDPKPLKTDDEAEAKRAKDNAAKRKAATPPAPELDAPKVVPEPLPVPKAAPVVVPPAAVVSPKVPGPVVENLSATPPPDVVPIVVPVPADRPPPLPPILDLPAPVPAADRPAFTEARP